MRLSCRWCSKKYPVSKKDVNRASVHIAALFRHKGSNNNMDNPNPKQVIEAFITAQLKVGTLLEDAMKQGDRTLAEVWLYMYQVLLPQEIAYWQEQYFKPNPDGGKKAV